MNKVTKSKWDRPAEFKIGDLFNVKDGTLGGDTYILAVTGYDNENDEPIFRLICLRDGGRWSDQNMTEDVLNKMIEEGTATLLPIGSKVTLEVLTK
jgi:hypothetical protein